MGQLTELMRKFLDSYMLLRYKALLEACPRLRMPFRPTFDFILIKPIKRRQSAVLEVVSFEKLNRGMVVAVGPGDYPKYSDTGRAHMRNMRAAFIPTELTPGDFILYVDMDAVPNYYKHHREWNADGTHTEYIIGQEKDCVGVGERGEIDPGGELSDAEVARLCALHNSPRLVYESRVFPEMML